MAVGEIYLTGAPGQNPREPLDVNLDNHITPMDLLAVVNAMRQPNEGSARRVHRHVFPDVDGDNSIAMNDAMRLLNWLKGNGNSGASSGNGGGHPGLPPEGEGCSPPTITGPTDVNEFQIFTVTGVAFGATSVSVSASGAVWAYVDIVGIENPVYGWTYNPQTGAYTRMLIFKDDSPPGTSQDPATVSISVEGDCGGTATHNLTIHNIDVSVSAEVLPTEITESETTNLEVTFTDATIDAHAILVDWGDGTISTMQFPDHEPPPPPLLEVMAFTDWPGPLIQTVQFSHQYLDDNPTGTPQDIQPIVVTVSDNDTSSATTTRNLTINNADPIVTIDQIIPLDDVIENGQIDETEGFRVVGHVTDLGTQDTHVGSVKTDLNFDGDTSDSGEEITISGGGESWTFNVIFSTVPDDGQSGQWNNETSFDELAITVDVTDDDTGGASETSTTQVNNIAPQFSEPPDVTFSTDQNGNPTEVVISGSFSDVGLADGHDVKITWGDGTTITERLAPGTLTFEIHRTISDPDGPLGNYFPNEASVTDDDLGTDTCGISCNLNENPITSESTDEQDEGCGDNCAPDPPPPTSANLDWDDFPVTNGPPPPSARTFTKWTESDHKIRYVLTAKRKCDETCVEAKATYSGLKIALVFDKNKSFVVDGHQTAALLAHERLHLKISEYVGERANAKAQNLSAVVEKCDASKDSAQTKAKDAARDALRKKLDDLMADGTQLAKKAHDKYDSDSDHGTNPTGQADWDQHWKEYVDAILTQGGW